MEKQELFESIDINVFHNLLQQYPDVLSEKLKSRDAEREAVIARVSSTKANGAGLPKEDLVTLVEWKLAHGTFRPTLRKLIQQNGNELVEQTTKEAFATYARATQQTLSSEPALKATLTTLTTLKGVGPATASLLLSTFDPDSAPFFSDELYRWALWEDGKGKGWDRKIKYDVKEYYQLHAKVNVLRQRLKQDAMQDVGALEAEKVAYVLGKSSSRYEQDGKRHRSLKRKRALERDPLALNAAPDQNLPSVEEEANLTEQEGSKVGRDIHSTTKRQVDAGRRSKRVSRRSAVKPSF